MGEEHQAALRGAIRRVVNETVANLLVTPEEGLAAIMHVAAVYVAQIKSPLTRAEYIRDVVIGFGLAVEIARGEEGFGKANPSEIKGMTPQ
jgi:hypothetical protein